MQQRWVLLLHELPDGSRHRDWMIERPGAGSGDGVQGLITFRVEAGEDGNAFPGSEPFEGERLADHRAAYLEYEGEVSGGRGRVRRVASGRCRLVRDEPNLLEVELATPQGARTVVGTRLPHPEGKGERGSIWRFAAGGPRTGR